MERTNADTQFHRKEDARKMRVPLQRLAGDWPNNYALANPPKVEDRRCMNIGRSNEGKAAWR